MSVRVVEIVNLSSPAGLADLLDAPAVMTVYNGNAFVLASVVATALLAADRPSAPQLRSHGFALGTSGLLPDLLAAYRLDAEGIVHEVLAWLSVPNGGDGLVADIEATRVK